MGTQVFRSVSPYPLADRQRLVKTRLRPRIHRETGARFDVPDLALTFGAPAELIWMIEAKIGASEGATQLERYETEGVRTAILKSVGSTVAEPGWHYSYLTLEGDEPAESVAFLPLRYEPLCDILPPEPDFSAEMIPAYHCLRRRLVDYCEERYKVPDDTASLESYLNDERGLITDKAMFHWLTTRLARRLGLRPAARIAIGRSSGEPLCQMRKAHWQGPK